MKSRCVPLAWLAATALGLALVLSPGASIGQESGSAGLITLDADSTSVNGILQILAKRSGLNIVTSSDVQGRRISIHLRDTPFEEALNLVVRSVGLGYEQVGNSILVADLQKLATQTGLATKIFDLQYANAGDLKELLHFVCPDITASPTGNRLIVRASPGTIDQVSSLIAQLDQKTTQVQLEARLIEVNTSKLAELGINWEKIAKWNTAITEGNQGKSTQGQPPTDLGYFKFHETADYYRQAAAFEVALDALLTEGKARLLSNVRVVTLENRPAEIFAGETVPVVITSLQSPGGAGGVFQTVQLEKIDVGVKLKITPRTSADGFITTLVQPEVSRIVAFLGPNNDLPETSTRRAQTLVRVRDGEKIYLGGLLSEENRRTLVKVPLLGDIPFLGQLFRHYRDETIRTDLVIEITPHVVGDAGAQIPTAPGGDPQDH